MIIQFNIKVLTVHAPTVDVFHENFITILETIRKIYGINVITIHPQKGTKEDALQKLAQYYCMFREMGITLAYENFYPSRKTSAKWILLPEDMFTCFQHTDLKITYDCAHAVVNDDTLTVFSKIISKIAVIHLSNQKSGAQHLPIDDGIYPIYDLLDLLYKSKYNGYVVLEYHPDYEKRLAADAQKVQAHLCRIRNRNS
jgi:sugar phosphate isomerase/epimerase